MPNILAKNVGAFAVSFTCMALHPGLAAHVETVLKMMQGGMFRLEAELPVTQAYVTLKFELAMLISLGMLYCAFESPLYSSAIVPGFTTPPFGIAAPPAVAAASTHTCSSRWACKI
jgi:hypothetical protein